MAASPLHDDTSVYDGEGAESADRDGVCERSETDHERDDSGDDAGRYASPERDRVLVQLAEELEKQSVCDNVVTHSSSTYTDASNRAILSKEKRRSPIYHIRGEKRRAEHSRAQQRRAQQSTAEGRGEQTTTTALHQQPQPAAHLVTFGRRFAAAPSDQ
jgi:hypothetical protein